MARGSMVSVSGFKEARETLQTLPKTVQRNVGSRALMPAGEVIAAAARTRAPVSADRWNPTPGSLRVSIRVRRARGKGTAARAEVIAEDIAAAPTEFGLVSRDYPAKPWFRPAVDAADDQALRVFGDHLKIEIEIAAKRAAKRSGA